MLGYGGRPVRRERGGDAMMPPDPAAAKPTARFAAALHEMIGALTDAADATDASDATRLFAVLEAFAAGVLLAGDYSAAGIEDAAARLLYQARAVAPPSLAPETEGRRLALVRGGTPDVRALVNELMRGGEA